MKKKENSREQQKKGILIVLILFAAALTIGIIGAVTENNQKGTINDKDSTFVENTVVTNEAETPQVTGYEGQNDTLIAATISNIVDGKTIVVNVGTNTLEVSMIGVSIPSDCSQSELEYLNGLLPVGKEVWLQYDESTTNDSGQELCYVWITNKVNVYSYTACKEKMVQGLLITNNLAEPVEEYPNSRYETDFQLMNEG